MAIGMATPTSPAEASSRSVVGLRFSRGFLGEDFVPRAPSGEARHTLIDQFLFDLNWKDCKARFSMRSTSPAEASSRSPGGLRFSRAFPEEDFVRRKYKPQNFRYTVKCALIVLKPAEYLHSQNNLKGKRNVYQAALSDYLRSQA